MAEIRVEKLSKTLDGLHTLENISLEIHNNEVVVVLGPSGCGKSTLLNIISGLLTPDRGGIKIDGLDWSGRTGRVSYMQQKDLLLDSCTILDNLSIPLVLKGVRKAEARESARSHLREFGLEGFAGYYPRQLSGGMRQRAALLRTYLFARDILLLDEPFASLDAITRHKMHLWLLELQKSCQSSILLVTHDIEEALLMADRIYVFSARPARVRLELDLHQSRDDQLQIKKEIMQILEEESGDEHV